MFTGREFDPETDNYYYRARYYNPQIGRFLQPDPIGYYDSMNLYEYCWNNPVKWRDPFGLQPYFPPGSVPRDYVPFRDRDVPPFRLPHIRDPLRKLAKNYLKKKFKKTLRDTFNPGKYADYDEYGTKPFDDVLDWAFDSGINDAIDNAVDELAKDGDSRSENDNDGDKKGSGDGGERSSGG